MSDKIDLFNLFPEPGLYETQHWLRRAYKRDLLKEEEVNRIKPIIDELAPKLNAYLKSIGKMPKKTTDN